MATFVARCRRADTTDRVAIALLKLATSSREVRSAENAQAFDESRLYIVEPCYVQYRSGLA